MNAIRTLTYSCFGKTNKEANTAANRTDRIFRLGLYTVCIKTGDLEFGPNNIFENFNVMSLFKMVILHMYPGACLLIVSSGQHSSLSSSEVRHFHYNMSICKLLS